MIEIKDLTFAYRRQDKVFQGLSYVISKGTSVGLVGDNGSGKSTLIKLMLAILTPASGAVYYDGQDIAKQRRHLMKRIGVVWGQRTSLWWDLTVQENMYKIGALFDMSANDVDRQIAQLTQELTLQHLMHQPLQKTSFGQRILVDILAVLMRQPRVIFFDEAFIGLDFEIKRMVFRLLKRYKEQYPKSIYIITSHQFDDIVNLCDRVAYINHGSITEYSLNDLVQEKSVEVYIESTKPLMPELFAHHQVISCDDCRASIKVTGSLNELFRQVDWDDITRIEIQNKTLEQALQRLRDDAH